MKRILSLGALAAGLAACSGDLNAVPQHARQTLSRIGAPPPSVKSPPAPVRTPAPLAPTATPPPTPPPTATRFVPPPPTPTATAAPTPQTAPRESGAPYTGVEKLAAARGLAPVTVAISLPSVHDFSDLDQRPEFNEALKLAKRYPQAPIFLTVYVTKADAHEREADPKELSDLMLVELARLIAERGIAAERISGIGMGVNPAIGRRLVFSLDIAGTR